MAKGNTILINQLGEYHGHFVEGKIAAGETPKPGTIMQYDISEAQVGGRWLIETYNADADGGRPKGPFIVLLEDHTKVDPFTTAYAAGENCVGYVPRAGDELNLLLANIAGTGDDHTKGEMLIVDDTTGKMIATTGSPETEVAMLNETITDPTADQLVWCTWTGY